MSNAEIVEILRNDGLITYEGMILVNLVSLGKKHVLMFGEHFTDATSYGNEIRVKDANFRKVHDGSLGKIWTLDYLDLVYHAKETELNSIKYQQFQALQKVKKEHAFDFDAVQERLKDKFNDF